MFSPLEKKIIATYANEKLILSLSLLHTHTLSSIGFGSFWPNVKSAICPIFGHLQLSQDGGIVHEAIFHSV